MLFPCMIAIAVIRAAFGRGTGPIVLTSVDCNGTESSLLSCSHQVFGATYCLHSNDAGVVCPSCKWFTRCKYSQCMPRAHLMTFEPTGDTCALLLVGFCDGRPCATISVTKCEKDGKAYAERVHWVPESKQGFKHLTEREDMVFSRDGQIAFLKTLTSFHAPSRDMCGWSMHCACVV